MKKSKLVIFTEILYFICGAFLLYTMYTWGFSQLELVCAFSLVLVSGITLFEIAYRPDTTSFTNALIIIIAVLLMIITIAGIFLFKDVITEFFYL